MTKANYFGVFTALAVMAATAFVVVMVAYDTASAQATPPPVRILDVVPDGGSEGIAHDRNIGVQFDSDMNEDTINNKTFKLVKKGSRKPVAAQISYDVACRCALLNPDKDLKPGATYKAIVVGGRDGVRNVDDGKLDGVDDVSATFKKGKVFWSVTICGMICPLSAGGGGPAKR